MIDLNKNNSVTNLNLQKSTNVPPQNKKDKKEKKKKESVPFIKSPAYIECTSHFFRYYLLLFGLTFVIFISQFLIAKTNEFAMFFIIFLTIFDFLYYMLFKNELPVKHKNKAYWLFLLMVPFALNILINHFLIDSITFSITFLRILMGFCDAAMFAGYIIFLSQESFRDSFAKIRDNDITLKMKEDLENKIEIDEEDAILGFQVDMDNLDANGFGTPTDIPVVLPAKDRFLHMLILGPTGCGKTSQTIIPFIWRDISITKEINGKPVGITVLEPKGDLAEKVYAMVNYKNNAIDEAIKNNCYDQSKHGIKRTVVYFNPILSGCPYFNPLEGDESDVIENMCTTFNMLNADAPQFFKDMTDGLVRRSVKLLKRLHGDEATLLDLNTLVWNVNDKGRKDYVMPLKRKSTMPDGSPIPPDIQIENDELIDWFLNDYYAGIGGAKGAPKTYENTSGVRTQITKLVSNKYLKKALNPPKQGEDGYMEYLQFQQQCAAEGHPYKINFDEALREGYVVTMSTAQGALRDLGRFLGYFIILQLQASVFRRPGNENTRTHNMLYIDEFQVYSNPGFADMLTQGRSYRVASHLATQARAQIGMGSGRDGKSFIELVSTNARNKIIYPGVSFDDAKYYSDEFGEFTKVSIQKSYRQKQWFSMMNDKQLSLQEKEEEKARFSPTDIIDKPFGQITYRIIKNNSVSCPGVSKISYIPKEVNDTLDEMIAADNAARLGGNAIKDYNAAMNANGHDFDSSKDLLKFNDPINQMQTEYQIPKPITPQVQETFDDAVYKDESKNIAPTSFVGINLDGKADDFSEYDFGNLKLSAEREKQIQENSIKERPFDTDTNLVKAQSVTSFKAVNPQVSSGPQVLSRENRVPPQPIKPRMDVFGDVTSSNNVKPIETKQPITPIPAHTKTQLPPEPKPVVVKARKVDDI